MKQGIFTIESQRVLANDLICLTLLGDTDGITAPGQFVNLKLNGFFLRRPISVCDAQPGRLTLIYKLAGEGTRALAAYAPGTALDVLTGLGNGFSLAESGERPLLVGGGVGAAPLYGLCRRLCAAGKRPTVVLGFNAKTDVYFEEEFRALGAEVIVATADGSYGVRGLVSDVMRTMDYEYFYACGPLPMLKAVYRESRGSGQFSLEERMGCGFGACMGCTCETTGGAKRVCRDGPVLRKEELLW